jgi:multimeric flavodoxin WrbA
MRLQAVLLEPVAGIRRSIPMKIIAINGSPRKSQSRTAQVVKQILAGAESSGALTEFIDITAMDIRPCTGCDRCHHLGECALKDDFNGLFQRILESDGLVLGSPVYIYQVTAQLKAFIDRLGEAIHCQLLLGKYGAVAATAGGSGHEETAQFLESLLVRLGAQHTGRIACTLDDGIIPSDAPVMTQAWELGIDLVNAVKNKREYPEQLHMQEGIRQYFKAIITKRKERWDWEYSYWCSKGWL